jgi:hypothetical protein
MEQPPAFTIKIGIARVGANRHRVMVIEPIHPQWGQPARYYCSADGLSKMRSALQSAWPDVPGLGAAEAQVFDFRRFASKFDAPNDAFLVERDTRHELIDLLSVHLYKLQRGQLPILADEH